MGSYLSALTTVIREQRAERAEARQATRAVHTKQRPNKLAFAASVPLR